jgi:hypothetical protein
VALFSRVAVGAESAVTASVDARRVWESFIMTAKELIEGN